MKNTYTKIFIGLSTLAIVALVMPTHYSFAKTTAGAKAETAKQTRVTNLKTKADTEIDRRVKSINDLLTRLGEVKKLSDTEKTSLNATLQDALTKLNDLKTKLDSDTDLTTLQADRKAIMDQYRVYMLLLPQSRIIATADGVDTNADLLTGMVTKLQAKILTVPAGTDATAMNASIADMQTQITTAKAKSDSAKSAVAGLVPDGGDKAKSATNTAALKSAKDMLKTAMADLQAARKDASSVRDALKKAGVVTSDTKVPNAGTDSNK